jgi:predicted metal-binding protein
MSPEKLISQIERERIFAGPVEAVCDPTMTAHCLDKYPNHSKGCPNWDQKEGCPPNIRYFPNVYSTNVYIAAVRFNFAEYLTYRRESHPDWTDRALKNPLYWQGHVRHELNELLFDYLSDHPEIDGEIVFNPEAMGVNLFETCAKAGIHLEKTPTNFVYKVALVANLIK